MSIRKLSNLVLLPILILSFSACNDSSEDNATTQQTAQQQMNPETAPSPSPRPIPPYRLTQFSRNGTAENHFRYTGPYIDWEVMRTAVKVAADIPEIREKTITQAEFFFHCLHRTERTTRSTTVASGLPVASVQLDGNGSQLIDVAGQAIIDQLDDVRRQDCQSDQFIDWVVQLKNGDTIEATFSVPVVGQSASDT